VRIALNLKGIDVELVPRHLLRDGGQHKSAAYREINPQGLVPALVDGQLAIGQSLAIMEYLEECYPQPPLLPRAPGDRARVRAMCQVIACDIHPLNNLRVLQYLAGSLGQSEDRIGKWYRHWIGEGFSALEVLLARHSADGRYCFGSSASLADACLVPQVYNARRYECSLDDYPTLLGICTHLEGLPAFARAAPAAQPDAE